MPPWLESVPWDGLGVHARSDGSGENGVHRLRRGLLLCGHLFIGNVAVSMAYP